MEYRRVTRYQGGGLGGPIPRDIAIIIAVYFATFVLSCFRQTAFIPALLQLTLGVYVGQIWRLVTYPYIGDVSSNFWIVIEMLMIYWFGRDVFSRLGRRLFWRIMLTASIGAAIVASVFKLLGIVLGFAALPVFIMMNGRYILLAIIITAFGRILSEATIYYSFLIPIKAQWFPWIIVLSAFIGFLITGDLTGFIGIIAAVVITTALLTPGGWRSLSRSWRQRLKRFMMQRRLDRLRRKRQFDVFDGDPPDKNRWVH